MSEHTKEPWGVVSEKWYLNGQPSIVGRNGAGFAVALMAPWGPAVNDSVDKREANARRIVACVNACAEIGTEALEAGVVRDLVAACRKVHNHLPDFDCSTVTESGVRLGELFPTTMLLVAVALNNATGK